MAYVDIDLNDFDTEDLVQELESRGLKVGPNCLDATYELYRDYIDGKDFDRKLKTFFRNELGLVA